MAKYKYLDKKYLNYINHLSRDIIKYNRSLQQELVDALPEDKLFPIMFTIIHEHIMGKSVEPHMRCMIAVPANAINESTEFGFKTNSIDQVILDIEMGLFNLLPEVDLPDLPVKEDTVSG
jgi:hypothetical protein